MAFGKKETAASLTRNGGFLQLIKLSNSAFPLHLLSAVHDSEA